jgi:hypothetical protein
LTLLLDSNEANDSLVINGKPGFMEIGRRKFCDLKSSIGDNFIVVDFDEVAVGGLGMLVGIDVDIFFISIRELINAKATGVGIEDELEMAKGTDELVANFEFLFIGFF